MGKICEKNALTEARYRLISIMLALRHFELDHRALPQRLEELCPSYLVSVPLDPFDNQPMRWNPETWAVYSVGPDLKDDGGSFSKPYVSKDKDVGMTYWWATSSK